MTNEDNWRVIRDRKIWGVSERYRRVIEAVRPGDYLVFYVMPKRVMGVFKAASKPFESRERIFPWSGAFSSRPSCRRAPFHVLKYRL